MAAQEMLAVALLAERRAYLEANAGELDATGKRLVVGNGYARPREVTTGAGMVEVTAPRVDDRREGERFSSAILPGSPPLTLSTVVIVIAAALAVANLATLVPAIQAARTSTIAALADAARPPRRHRLLIVASTRLPVPLLLGVRLATRRPRRTALGALSVAVSVAGIVAVLIERSRLGGTSGLANPKHQRITQVPWVITIILIVLAAINAILMTWAPSSTGDTPRPWPECSAPTPNKSPRRSPPASSSLSSPNPSSEFPSGSLWCKRSANQATLTNTHPSRY
jgi:hypothetical protein